MLVGGDSAGGNLAFATALELRDTGGPALRGILALYPVCDSDFTTPSYREFTGGHGLTDEKMRFYWRVYAPHAMTDALAAALRAELAGLTPVLVQLAELDVLRSEGENMAERLDAAGVPTELEIFLGVLHGFMHATGTVATAATPLLALPSGRDRASERRLAGSSRCTLNRPLSAGKPVIRARKAESSGTARAFSIRLAAEKHIGISVRLTS